MTAIIRSFSLNVPECPETDDLAVLINFRFTNLIAFVITLLALFSVMAIFFLPTLKNPLMWPYLLTFLSATIVHTSSLSQQIMLVLILGGICILELTIGVCLTAWLIKNAVARLLVLNMVQTKINILTL